MPLLSGDKPHRYLANLERDGLILDSQSTQPSCLDESCQRLEQLQSILKQPANAKRLEELSNYYLPFGRKESLAALKLCHEHCTKQELKVLSLSFWLCPYGSNGFRPDYANRLNGCEHLSAKLEQDFIWSQFSLQELLKLYQLDDHYSKFVTRQSEAGQRVALRYIQDLQDKNISEAELGESLSLFKQHLPVLQLLQKTMSLPPPVEAQDRRQSLYSDMVLEQVAGLPRAEKIELMRMFGANVALGQEPNTYSISFAAQIARRIASYGRNDLDNELWQAFCDPIQKVLNDPSTGYASRQNLAREVGLCARINKPIFSEIVLPSDNMPTRFEVFEGKTPDELKQIKTAIVEALFDNAKLSRLVGDGLLGQLFPDIFGSSDKGGIKGKKQHAGHDYTLDAHTFMVMHYVRENAQFAQLSQYDKTNLLWAAFLHDIAKREGQLDPDHERASAGVAYGLLSLGYPPQQVTRISTLISRHGDISYVDPWGRQADLNDPQALKDLSVLYSNPVAAMQLRILNEADIKATKFGAKLWTPEVEQYLDEITKRLEANVGVLNQNRLPVLTSALPRQFQPVVPKGSYAYLVHSSLEMDKLFWDQIGMINSTNCSLSAALVTQEVGEKIYKDVDVVAVLAAPPENFAAAYRSNLLTGHSINWKGHVQLVNDWVKDKRSKEMVDALQAELGTQVNSAPSLEQIQKESSKYNSLDELRQAEGEASDIYKAQLAMDKVLTHAKDGSLIQSHNEVKTNNPSIAGIGIFRRNRRISLESVTSLSQLKSIFASTEVPSYFVGQQGSQNSLVIPQRVWQEAKARHLPLLILDK